VSRNISSSPESHSPTANVQQPQISPMPRIRTSFRHRRNMLLDLPIAGRLTLGFLVAALLATLVTGAIGLQHAQLLDKQASFYHDLLQVNTTLNTGATYLQLMNSQLQVTLSDASAAQPSHETLNNDQKALQGLGSRYNAILTDYIKHHLIGQNTDEESILDEAGYNRQIQQQSVLAGSALRSWQVYETSQGQILKDISTETPTALAEAQYLEHSQGQPTNADAWSSLRALIQFNANLTSLVQDGANVEEQTELIITIISSILTFVGIALVGWLISGTLVRRLKELRRVTQAVEQGKLNERVIVVGRDEIADVSASVNAMLDTILALLEESRSQRDALTNAAEHLFTDMRVVSAGDLRVNAPVSNDPIGMLANAFNFTVGRFRRFVLRTHGAIEQIDVLVRHQIERTESFLQALNRLASITPPAGSKTTPSGELRSANSTSKEVQAEMVRLSFDFASEIVAQSRKITSITQEMRQGAVSFQLDASNSNDQLSPSQPLNPTQGNDVAPGIRPQMASPRGRYAPPVKRELSLPGSQTHTYEPDPQRSSSPQRLKTPPE
jgi:methyl-accepting chemotaxis protein